MKKMNVHPFPARMASELALDKIGELRKPSVILDPMTGSGTVISAASEIGHRSIGMDVDPLAILMSKVATAKLDHARLDKLAEKLIREAARVNLRQIKLPWMDSETEAFIRFWFAPDQRRALTRLSYVLATQNDLSNNSSEANALRLAVSRLIITKDKGASLARDVSHSRPHKVADQVDFDVFDELRRSTEQIKRRLTKVARERPVVRLGDARLLPWVRDSSIDMVMTSPPYLNAIDYMRGHRLSLVWLGYSLSRLRAIRSNSIGAERGLGEVESARRIHEISSSLGKISALPARHQRMIDRYCFDLILMMKQVSRVLKRDGQAIFVVGNSCLKDVFISNAQGLAKAAELAELVLIDERERDLPVSQRYLPMPKSRKSALGRRMRTETVLTFSHR